MAGPGAATRRRLAVLLAALAAAAPSAGRAAWRQPFEVLGPDDGLPTGMVVSLAQDRDGFLWMGTENGLVRYEGGHHRRYTVEDGLPSAYISRVVATRDGAIWLATTRGLVRRAGGGFEAATLGAEGTAPPIVGLVEDEAGRLWAATQQRIYRQGAGLAFEAVAWRPEKVGALAAGRRSGAVYAAVEDGVRAFFPDGRTQAWTPADGLPRERATLLVEDGAGRLWAGSGRTLAALEPGGARFVDRSALLGGPLSPASQPWLDRDGSIWVPTQAGALRVQGESATRLDDGSGLPFRWVRSVFRDREGTLWVLGPTLARLQGGGRVWNDTLTPERTGAVVWFVTRGPGGALLAGTDDGAFRLGPGGAVRIPGTEAFRVKGLAADRAGTLWLVSSVGGLRWVRPGQSAAEEPPLGPLARGLNTVLVDRDGTPWFTSGREGVLRWDAATGRLVPAWGPAQAGVPEVAAVGLQQDQAGRLWAGTDAGLLVREPDGTWRRFGPEAGLQSGGVRCLAVAPDGTTWISFAEPAGLSQVRLDGARLSVLRHVRRGPGLRSEQIYALAPDAQGRLWAGTEQGLDLVGTPLHVGRRDGMVSEDVSIQGLRVEGDEVLVGTAGGLVRYRAAGAGAAPEVPPQAFVTEALLGERRLEAPFGEPPPVPAAAPSAAFRVAAPVFADEEGLRFEVRLIGLEDAWRAVDGRQIRYPGLAGGRYRFEVRAAAAGGLFGPAAGLDFAVLPPWWATWWARALAALVLLGALAGLVRLRVASLARAKRSLEAEVAARTAELTARNAELSVALKQVKELSGLLPICMHCHKIRNDKGYWERMEKYIGERSKAAFSHGLCPDCVHRYDEPDAA